MTNFKILNNKIIKNVNSLSLLVIFIAFLSSVLLSKYYLDNYDVNVSSGGSTYHKMIKTDSHRYLSHGAEIKEQIKNGINFFETGRDHYTKYLPPRIAALYYSFFDINFSENPKTGQVNTGNHFFYLLFQNLFYFLSITFLYFRTLEILDKKILLFSLLFLCFEPTIFQYHSSFWSESIFFSFQIIILGLMLTKKKSFYLYLIIGLLVGLLSLQRQLAIFYIIPILIYTYFFDKKKLFINFPLIILGFFIIQIFLGVNNFKRSGKFYIMTADSKVEMHRNLVVKVMTKKLKVSNKEFEEFEGKKSLEWIIKNDMKTSLDYDKIKIGNAFTFYRDLLSESDKVIFDGFIRKRTFTYIYQNPIDFFKFSFNSAIHLPLLNPFHIYSENHFKSSEIYYLSEKHNQLIPIRVVYSVLIYFFIVFGLIHFFSKKDYKTLFYLIISFLYFYATVFWHGNTRYFLPSYIYLSIFFGAGLNYITFKIRAYLKKK